MPVESFYTYLRELRKAMSLQGKATAAPGVAATKWVVPSNFPADVDIQDPEGWKKTCDRTDLNQFCTDEYDSGAEPNKGRIGNVMAAKQAIDHWSAFERAMHARYASGVRCRIWAGARRSGHGDDYYGVLKAFEASVDALLAAATERPNTPDVENEIVGEDVVVDENPPQDPPESEPELVV